MKKKLNIYITDKCNKQCPWCYVDKKANKTMDIKTANRIIDYVNSHTDEIDSVVLIGGEPFVEQKLMLHFIDNFAKLDNDIAIMTNGTIDMSNFISSMRNYSGNRININMSFIEVNDPDNEKRIKNIELLHQHNIELVTLVVLTPERIDSILKMIRYLEQFNPYVIKVLRMHMLGDYWTDKDTERYAQVLPDLIYENIIYNFKHNEIKKIYLPNKIHIDCDHCFSMSDTTKIHCVNQEGIVTGITVGIDGKKYLCDGAYGKRSHSFGYLWEEKENPYIIKEFGYQDVLYNYCYMAHHSTMISFDKLCDQYRDRYTRIFFKLKELKEGGKE